MLIICDLDDTLVQTTATLTPHLLKIAVLKMVEEGLQLPDIGLAISEIQAMDLKSPSSRETLRKFLHKHGASEKYFEIGCKAVYENFSSTLPLEPMRCVNEILYSLSKKHFLVLVTAGKEVRQLTKMEKAGIEPSLFSKIIVCDTIEKGAFYQELASEFEVAPHEVVVCGDRIAVDLVPAKELGFTTVHIRQGRGQIEPSYHEAVDYSIEELTELQGLVTEEI